MTTTTSSLSRSERLSSEQKALLHQRDSVELSKRRVLHDLETSTSPLYRRNLEAGLAFLEQKIAEIDRTLIDLESRPAPSRPKMPIARRPQKR